MRAQLRYLHSPDAVDLRDHNPKDSGCFCILVQAMIGPRGGEGEESFDFLVCTPRWLETKVSEEEYLFGRHYLIVPKFDYDVLWRAIEDLCHHVDGPDWETIGNRLGRYGHWEFEDYRE